MAKQQFFHSETAQLFRQLEHLSQRPRMSRGQAFEDWLTAMTCALAGGTMEDQYMAMVQRHKEEGKGQRGIDLMPEMFGQLVNTMEQTRADVLGDLFQGAITYGEAGQYLTPASPPGNFVNLFALLAISCNPFSLSCRFVSQDTVRASVFPQQRQRKRKENVMANLTRASKELFTRSPDERFESLGDLCQHCRQEKELARDRWHPPQTFQPELDSDRVTLRLGDDGTFNLNHWSFSQLCRLCGVNKDTIVRLSPETATRALTETIPSGNKPMQVFTGNGTVRSIHGVTYSRLWNADLLAMLREHAGEFQPPPKGANDGTGLYCGEQDMFCFLIDPAGWIEINDQAFAPGFFLWKYYP